MARLKALDPPASDQRDVPKRAAPKKLCTSSGRRTRFREMTFPQVRGDEWSGTGSNCRPSAFQVNRVMRCADLRKRTSPTSETALGGRCYTHGSRGRRA